MGNGSGPGALNSRVYTNSYAFISNQAYFPFYARQAGNSFYGTSRPQYSWLTYHNLAYLGAGAGQRQNKWLQQRGIRTSYLPPGLTK
jgi:hypothetical protein